MVPNDPTAAAVLNGGMTDSTPTGSITPQHGHRRLSETWRSSIAVVIGLLALIPLIYAVFPPAPMGLDYLALYSATYLLAYVVMSIVIFTRASHESIERWARTGGRGGWLQRYVLGTTPGPGLSITMGAMSLVLAVLWLPHGRALGSTMSETERLLVGLLVMVGAWSCMVVSFTIAYYADNLLEEGKALEFPGPERPRWGDYLYLSAGVSATFGTTDVTVTSPKVRRTMTVHCLLAFVFNTVILGSVVGLLA